MRKRSSSGGTGIIFDILGLFIIWGTLRLVAPMVGLG